MMRILLALILVSLPFLTWADEKPKVAVTDLAYEEKVKDYVNVSDNNEQTNHKTEGTYTYINQAELHVFMGDVKGAIKKQGLLSLIQGKPYSNDVEGSSIYDVIARIEKGDFAGADYVLFGTLSDIQFTENVANIQHTNTNSKILALTVTADFSLIDVNTHEIKAAFTASGSAKEVRFINSLDQKVTLNRALLVRNVSKELGVNIASQLAEQLTGKLPDEDYTPPVRNNVLPDLPPMIIRRP